MSNGKEYSALTNRDEYTLLSVKEEWWYLGLEEIAYSGEISSFLHSTSRFSLESKWEHRNYYL